MAGWILRTFKLREKNCMLALWKALVQPILDYCSQLWSPHKRANIQALESVQCYFIRNIWGMQNSTYWEILRALGLYSQQRRRERYQIIYMWKILEKHVPNPFNIHSIPNARTGRRCYRKTLPTQAPAKVKSQLMYSFNYYGPKIFNCLPSAVRNLTGCTEEKFKSALDKFLRDIPDEPPVQGYTSQCRAPSNSLPDQVDLQLRDTGCGRSRGAPWL